MRGAWRAQEGSFIFAMGECGKRNVKIAVSGGFWLSAPARA